MRVWVRQISKKHTRAVWECAERKAIVRRVCGCARIGSTQILWNFHSKNIIDFEKRLPFFGQFFLEFLNFRLGAVFLHNFFLFLLFISFLEQGKKKENDPCHYSRYCPCNNHWNHCLFGEKLEKFICKFFFVIFLVLFSVFCMILSDVQEVLAFHGS